MKKLLAGFVVLALGGVAACDDDVRIDRGRVTVYQGSYTFTTSSGAGTYGGVAGTEASELRIDDFDPYENGSCTASDAEFTMHVGACTLFANAATVEHDTGGKYASGDFLSASADLQSNQVCTLSLDGKVGEIRVTGGSLALTPGNAVLNVTGELLAGDAAPSGGQITVVYHGNQ